MASPTSVDLTNSSIFGHQILSSTPNGSKNSPQKLLLIKYLRVGCLALSLVSLVFSATAYSTNRWSVSANELNVDKFNLPLTFADRHTKDAECKSKICRVLDERKDALLIGRIYRGLTAVCEMVQRRTGETLVLTCAKTDDNFIDAGVIRRLTLSAVIMSTFCIVLAAWLLAIGLHRPISPSNKSVICGTKVKKYPVLKISECTLVLQVFSIVFYLLSSLLLAMGSVMFVSNKQTEEVVSYSFFFATVAFSCHLAAALAVGSDFFICAALNSRSHRANRDIFSHFLPLEGGSSGATNTSSTGLATDGSTSSNFSTVSALGIGGFRPITMSSKPPPNNASNQPQQQQQQQPANNPNTSNFDPPPFISAVRYHD